MKPVSDYFGRDSAYYGDREDWLVGLGHNRDSNDLEESNFEVFLHGLGGESDTVAVERFGHWGCGWIEVVLIKPGAEDKIEAAEEMLAALEDYPVLDDGDFCEREHAHAERVWESRYDNKERVAYMRKHRTEFDFYEYKQMLACARGKSFRGDAASLLD